MKNNEELRRKIDAWFEEQREQLIADVGRLVRVKSVRSEAVPGKPYGEGPAAALDEAAAILKEKRFTVENHDNHVITADLNGGEPQLGILAHLDTVAVGSGWTTDPFKPIVRDGKLFGRGVIDNKGPSIAAVYALAAARELAPSLTKGCRLILGSAEETGHEDLAAYRESNKMPPSVFTPDSSYPVVNLEKGRLVATFGTDWPESKALPRIVSIQGGETVNIVPNYAEAVVEGLPLSYIQALCVALSPKTGAVISAAAFHEGVKIKANGKSAHAMMPEAGVNAQTALMAVLAELPLADSECAEAIRNLCSLFPHGDTVGNALGIAMSDDLSGHLTANFGVLSLSLTGYTAAVDCRSPKCATEETLDTVVRQALADNGIDLKDLKKTPCHHTPEESALVQTLLKVYSDYTGNNGECLAFGGQTYVHDIDGGVAFGPAFPGVDNKLHGADEFIAVEDLILSAKMYTQVIIDMCT